MERLQQVMWLVTVGDLTLMCVVESGFRGSEAAAVHCRRFVWQQIMQAL
jgi:hypothetical protein